MSIGSMREDAFWRLVAALDSSGVLPHVMVIGTWAEWLYADYFVQACGVEREYRVDIGRTHDIDVYFRNHLLEIDGADTLVENLEKEGFVSSASLKGTFFYGGIEVEFLATQLGTGPGIVEIPSVGIMAERLKDLSLLKPAWVEKEGYRICIPSPASYVVQKLYINPVRRPELKKGQDIRKVSVLLETFREIPQLIEELALTLGSLSDRDLQRVLEVAHANGLFLPEARRVGGARSALLGGKAEGEAHAE